MLFRCVYAVYVILEHYRFLIINVFQKTKYMSAFATWGQMSPNSKTWKNCSGKTTGIPCWLFPSYGIGNFQPGWLPFCTPIPGLFQGIAMQGQAGRQPLYTKIGGDYSEYFLPRGLFFCKWPRGGKSPKVGLRGPIMLPPAHEGHWMELGHFQEQFAQATL